MPDPRADDLIRRGDVLNVLEDTLRIQGREGDVQDYFAALNAVRSTPPTGIGQCCAEYGCRDVSTTLRHRVFEFSEQPPVSQSPAPRVPGPAG